MAGGPSASSPRRALPASARVACAGAIAVVASLLLPWYGIPFSDGLSVTGLDRFGFAHAALLLTVGAAVLVTVRSAWGRTLPRPLRAAELVVAAGSWAALLTIYLIVDRPDALAGTTRVGLRMGPFVALGGCLVIVTGGLRMRAERK